ncbi:MAG: PepSY domain-containing protein [Rhizobiaceae bacterium]
MKKTSIVVTLLGSLLFVAPASATGLYSCDSGDRANWKSREALTAKVKAEGWQVRRVKVDGGCYELYGTTPEGERVEAYFHPVTLEKHLVARRGEVLFRKGE